MVKTNTKKFCSDNIGSTNYKNTSVSSISSTVTSKSATLTNQNGEPNEKRLDSITDEEIIQRNIQDLMDKKNREERKANGRLVAVILASLVIFLAAYHTWIKSGGKLVGVLVPAFIMLSFGVWVVILTKRDKAKQQIFETYLEEVALKNKQELETKSKSKTKKINEKRTSDETLLHYENEINKKQLSLTKIANGKYPIQSPRLPPTTSSILENNDQRKYRKDRNRMYRNSDYSTTSSKKSAHYAIKDLRVKRPSMRQKLFRQSSNYNMPTIAAQANATHTLLQAITSTPVLPVSSRPQIKSPANLTEAKHKLALQVPTMTRISSIP